MTRIMFDDLPHKVRTHLAMLHVLVKTEMPEITGVQITIDHIGLESPAIIDVRTIP